MHELALLKLEHEPLACHPEAALGRRRIGLGRARLVLVAGRHFGAHGCPPWGGGGSALRSAAASSAGTPQSNTTSRSQKIHAPTHAGRNSDARRNISGI